MIFFQQIFDFYLSRLLYLFCICFDIEYPSVTDNLRLLVDIMEEMEPQSGNASISLTCGHICETFSWLEVDIRGTKILNQP